jgi:hypothetical protein
MGRGALTALRGGPTAIVTPHRNNGQGQGCSRNYAKFNATLGLRIVTQPVNWFAILKCVRLLTY